MGYVSRFLLGSIGIVAAVTVFHELGHAGLDRWNGYDGGFRINSTPRVWMEGKAANYTRTVDVGQDVADVGDHHRVLNPATVVLAGVLGLMVLRWSSKAEPPRA
ncbi:MAG: hypothetical protein KY455_10135 [Euryarchaeota archaeon]|nr:hypothetical protein [Euryarchaeota archaeon]